jgi:hypothetical protein
MSEFAKQFQLLAAPQVPPAAQAIPFSAVVPSSTNKEIPFAPQIFPGVIIPAAEKPAQAQVLPVTGNGPAQILPVTPVEIAPQFPLQKQVTDSPVIAPTTLVLPKRRRRRQKSST